MTSAQIIDGKKIALDFKSDLKNKIELGKYARPPGLATVLVGEDPASAIYVASKRKSAGLVGIKSSHFELAKSASEEEVLELIDRLNKDDTIDAILVQLPLPAHICEKTIIEAIDYEKDVDGFHPNNLGQLLRGEARVIACTPLGIIKMIDSLGVDLCGKSAVVLGRSNIVGKPMAILLLERHATVTICHSRTKNLAEVTSKADIVVAAIGRAKFVTKDFIKPGAIVIDVGMNRDENNKLCGDVDFASVQEIASYITPVPGGVGPMTIAMLLNNAYENFLRRRS